MGPSRPWERLRLSVLITGLKTGLNRLLAGLPKQRPMLGGQPGCHRPPHLVHHHRRLTAVQRRAHCLITLSFHSISISMRMQNASSGWTWSYHCLAPSSLSLLLAVSELLLNRTRTCSRGCISSSLHHSPTSYQYLCA
jgi:hypothetical protein